MTPLAWIAIFSVALAVQLAMAFVFHEPLFILWAAASGWAIDANISRLRSGEWK